jgi:alpha-D-ribose 1-methylphosphonate 5-triphosphate synthase subunit PhnG
MATLARTPADRLQAALASLPAPPEFTRLRGPEIGMTMVQARMGGDGSPFNLGEATVTRCSVRLADGTVGHHWRLGRDKPAAEAAALLDALFQHDAALAQHITAPLAAQQLAARTDVAARAAATRVEFFGMVRMG